MSAFTCSACDALLPIPVPADDRDIGKQPVRLPFHRYRQTQAICPGAGRVVPVVAEQRDAS